MAFCRILLPVDFSQFSKVALEKTSKLVAGDEKREVHFLFVLHTPTDFSTWSGDPDAEMQQRLEELIREFQPRLPAQASATVRKGHPSTEICRYAESHECDLIVMATHGRTGLKHMLLVPRPNRSFGTRTVPCSRSACGQINSRPRSLHKSFTHCLSDSLIGDLDDGMFCRWNRLREDGGNDHIETEALGRRALIH